MYLIHWPASVNQFENWEEINISTWKAMMELYKEGRVKAIGVSNFMPHHLKALMETDIIPMVDQIEFHPGWMQKETVKYCKENTIQVEAWSPLGNGRVLNHRIYSRLHRNTEKQLHRSVFAGVCSIRCCHYRNR